jgi:hypothetical protein
MRADQAAHAEVEGNLISRLAPDEYEHFVASREEATENQRDWKTAARFVERRCLGNAPARECRHRPDGGSTSLEWRWRRGR